jgi:hypothetical protein
MSDSKSVQHGVEAVSGIGPGNGNSAFDFDLNDADLALMQSDEPSGSNAAVKESFSLDTATDEDEKLTSDHDVKSKSKMNLVIIAGVLIGSIVLVAFGYFAVKVLGGGSESSSAQAPIVSAQVSDFSREGAAVGNSFSDVSDSGSNDFSVTGADAGELAAALGVSQPVQEISQQPRQEQAETVPAQPHVEGKNILITQGIETLGEAIDESPSVEATTKVSEVSDEERLYDNLLSSVEGMDVPPEAIKIDQNVINRSLENQRLATFEQEIKEARSSMAGIQGAVESIRAQVGEFSQVLEKNSADQTVINESIAKLTQEVKQLSAAQEKELKAIKAQVSNVQRKADQAVASADEVKRSAQVQPRVVAQPAPLPVPTQAPAPVAVRQQVTPVEQVRQPQVQAPVTATVAPRKVFEETRNPATVQVAAQVTGDGSNMPAHCDGSRVSANWRVKGVNSHSAYVVRTQDQQGMYLKAGVDVPGYGQVQAFDATNRAVCTTNGLIRR